MQRLPVDGIDVSDANGIELFAKRIDLLGLTGEDEAAEAFSNESMAHALAELERRS